MRVCRCQWPCAAADSLPKPPPLLGALPGLKADVWGTEVEEGLQLDPAKLKEAIKRQERLQRQQEEEDGVDDRKRK